MTYEGAKATIGDKGGYTLCTTSQNSNNFSTAWVMIQAGNGYAQSGNMYRWGYGNCVKRWAEQVSPTNVMTDGYLGGCTTPNTSNTFWEQSLLIGSDYRIRSDIDTSMILQSSFSPFSWSGKFDATFFSEAIFIASDVPGSPAAPEDWSNMQVQNYADDSWNNTCGNANMGIYNDGGHSTRWGLSGQACNHIQSWTN